MHSTQLNIIIKDDDYNCHNRSDEQAGQYGLHHLSVFTIGSKPTMAASV